VPQGANGNGSYAAAAVPYEEPTRHVPPAGRQNFAKSCDEYRAEHGLVVQGASVPDPLQTFESVGFPPNIMDEVPSRPVQAALLLLRLLRPPPDRAARLAPAAYPARRTHAAVACAAPATRASRVRARGRAVSRLPATSREAGWLCARPARARLRPSGGPQ